MPTTTGATSWPRPKGDPLVIRDAIAAADMIDLGRLEPISYDTGDPEGWATLSEVLLLAIASCDDLAELLAVLGCGGIADLTYLEGGLEPIHLEAILARADAWSSLTDAAGAIGMAVRATAYDPGALVVLDDLSRGDKPHLFGVLDDQLERWRRGLRAAPPLRAASAHALGRCPGAVDADVDRLLENLDDELDDAALASRMIAAAAIARRRKRDLSPVPFERRLDHRSELVRCCAVAALAHFSALDRRQTEVLAEAMRDPKPLPLGWGWRWVHFTERTDAIAVRVLTWAATEAPSSAVLALCEGDCETMFESDALFRLAFPDVPPLGVALDDLDDTQRRALGAFARAGLGRRRDLLRRLGLHLPADVEPFLAGEGPLWTVRDVATEDGARRWHMARIWREHIAGVVCLDAAAEAILQGQAPEALVEAICHPGHGPLLASNASDAEAAERDQRLTHALVRRLQQGGFDLATACRAMMAQKGWHAVSWAICLLVAFDRPPRGGGGTHRLRPGSGAGRRALRPAARTASGRTAKSDPGSRDQDALLSFDGWMARARRDGDIVKSCGSGSGLIRRRPSDLRGCCRCVRPARHRRT